jgi:hypothetical protein
MHAYAGKARSPSSPHESVHDVLRTPSRPLERRVRAHFESRFQHDFSRVRVHDDSEAARSADHLRAHAYTVGSDIVFGAQQYDPGSRAGHRLLAHELGHVVQQGDASIVNDLTIEQERSVIAPLHRRSASIMRADRDAVRQVKKLENVVGAGIHFFPNKIIDTKIGPIETRSAGSNRLNVIIAEGLSPRLLARELLPLWTTATPFTPPSGGPSVLPGPLTEEQLAQALLVWNDTYLGLPNMGRWRVGLTLPLPIDLDDAGIGTLNPDQIRSAAGMFEATQMDLLDHRATANVALPAPLLSEEARIFLEERQSAFARGLAITVRATTNALASHQLITAVFKQLSPMDGLEVAIEAIENMSPTEMDLLANQTSGGLILDTLDDAISRGPKPTPQPFEDRLTGARARLDQFPAHFLNDPPSNVTARDEKTVTVDTVKVDGSRFTPATQVQVANAIYAQCNVRFAHGVDATAPATFLGDDNKMQATLSCSKHTKEERALFDHAHKDLGFNARIQAYFIPEFKGVKESAYSYPPLCTPGKWLGATFISNTSDNSTLAHEIGHILLNSAPHPKGTIMGERPRPNEITDRQCKRIYESA